jgi:hypothetical protein
LDSVTSIIFCTALSEYDQVLEEERRVVRAFSFIRLPLSLGRSGEESAVEHAQRRWLPCARVYGGATEREARV